MEQSWSDVVFQVCPWPEVGTGEEQNVTIMGHFWNKFRIGTHLEQTLNRTGIFLEQTWNFHSDFVLDLHPPGAPLFVHVFYQDSRMTPKSRQIRFTGTTHLL